MIKIDKNKFELASIHNLMKEERSAETIMNKLKEIESEKGFSMIKDRIIKVIIDSTEVIDLGEPISWGGEDVYTKRELWKKLNGMGVYYTVPFWKLDKTIRDIIHTREIKQAMIDKEQQLIEQLMKK